MRAEDALPDHQDTATFEGVTVRKGTLAAFLANARTIADDHAEPAARALAARDIADSLPALRAIGLFEVMAVREARVRALVEGTLAPTGDAT